MSDRVLFMPDKIIRSGTAFVYDNSNNVVANINYNYFSMRKRLEITDSNQNLVTKGQIKMFSFRPTWYILDKSENIIGEIKQLFTFFSRNFVYINSKGDEFKIDGNMFGRNFKIYQNEITIIEVSSTTSLLSMRPHSYLVNILDDSFDTFEAINLIEGIRNLVELSKSRD